MVKLRQASADFIMNAESLLRRSRILWGVFIVAAFFLSLHSTALAQGRTVRGEATVEAPDAKKKIATFVVDAKSGSRKAPERLTFPVLEDCVYREVTSTRKVRASFADLQAGQRVRVRIEMSPSITSPGYATEVIILAAKPKAK
jgi:hypothetical protein